MHTLRNHRFWMASVGGCTLLALVEATALHFDALRAPRPSSLSLLLLERAIADVAWLVMSAIVFVAMTQVTKSNAPVTAIAGRFTLIGVWLAPMYTTSDALAYAIVRDGGFATFGDRLQRIALTAFMWDLFLYVLLVLACYAFLLHQRARRRERESSELLARLTQAELALLRAQLEPHFLFNALNTISGLIRSRRHDAATSALAQLSELLRYVVEASRQERVPLEWELQFVSNYLELQQLRYGLRLQFAVHDDTVSRRCDVPPLLLQPLIENAVVHGAARTIGPARIDVRVTRHHARLSVDVQNSWNDRPRRPGGTTGVGLSNTRQRLVRMYGDSFSLVAGPLGPETYQVSVTLPRESIAHEPDQRAYR
ncbi:MAG: sensor histidine kinase [Gemmatimonadaceae bacterium]